MRKREKITPISIKNQLSPFDTAAFLPAKIKKRNKAIGRATAGVVSFSFGLLSMNIIESEGYVS